MKQPQKRKKEKPEQWDELIVTGKQITICLEKCRQGIRVTFPKQSWDRKAKQSTRSKRTAFLRP